MHGIEFPLRVSKQYFYCLAGLFLATMILIFYLSTTFTLKILSFFSLGLYASYLFWRDVFLRKNQAIIAMHYLGNKKWQITTRQTIYHDVALSGDSVITQFFTILRFSVPNKVTKNTSIIFPDSLPRGLYRKLLVTVKTG